MTSVVRFEISYTQFVDPAGRAVGPLPEFARAPAALVPLYRGMMLTRRFDAKAIALQRTGRLGTYASSLGQEAVTVGLASAMRAEDVLLPSYRETGAQLWRGVSLHELLLYWGGDERGSDFAGPRADFPVAVPIAALVPLTLSWFGTGETQKIVFLALACFVLLLPLAATSTNAMVKRLGGRRWQLLHRLVYAIAICGVLHFWWLVKKDIREPLAFAALLAVLLGARLLWRARRPESRPPARGH